MEKKKKRVLFTVLKVLGAFFAVIAGGTALQVRRGLSFLKKKGSNQNAMTCTAISCSSATIGKDIEVGAFSSLLGCLSVSWEEAPDHAFDLDLCSAFSMLSVIVPSNLRVVCDVKSVGGMVSNHTEAPEDENAPVLQITGKAICGMIVIRNAE
ncbi:MAG: hypothetical protein IJM57_08075 [Lachnospiraceae bacterium]|nr:hypothetical protein [Lachnospiraceae bacterium]